MVDKEYINLKLTKRELRTILIALDNERTNAGKNNDERKEFYSKETFKTILVELRYQNENIKQIFEEK